MSTEGSSGRAAWMRECRWGVFTHYLADTPSATESVDLGAGAWNERVESFDVDRLADQLARAGAGYYGITLGQNSGFYCSPNSTYDRIVGRAPSRCSRRDLPGDLWEALNKKGIRLMLYLPAGAPDCDSLAMEKLKWTNGSGPAGPQRLAEFQLMWESIIREWSLRYAEKVSAWWIDGCYFAKAMYEHPDAPNFASFGAALRAGNPHSALAFNPGVKAPIQAFSPWDDYTAGELDVVLPLHDIHRRPPVDGLIDGVQYQAFTFLGNWWAGQPCRLPDELVVGYTKYVNSIGGAMTWDVPISHDGAIPEDFLRQLALINR